MCIAFIGAECVFALLESARGEKEIHSAFYFCQGLALSGFATLTLMEAVKSGQRAIIKIIDQ